MIFLNRYATRLRAPHQSRERRNRAGPVISRVMRLRQAMLRIRQIVRLHQVRLPSLRLRIRTTYAWRKQLLLGRTETVICLTEFLCPENKVWLPVRSRQTVVTSTSGAFRPEPK